MRKYIAMPTPAALYCTLTLAGTYRLNTRAILYCSSFDVDPSSERVASSTRAINRSCSPILKVISPSTMRTSRSSNLSRFRSVSPSTSTSNEEIAVIGVRTYRSMNVAMMPPASSSRCVHAASPMYACPPFASNSACRSLSLGFGVGSRTTSTGIAPELAQSSAN